MKILLIIAILATGCVSRRGEIITPEGHSLKFSLPSIGAKSKVKKITMKVDGVVIEVEGYESDTVEAFKAGVQAGTGVISKALVP